MTDPVQTAETLPANAHNAMLYWRHEASRYAPGFFIGSEDEDGRHQRGTAGWPYSLYRKSAQPGVIDAVLCGGIQHIADAHALLDAVNNAPFEALDTLRKSRTA